MKPFALALIAGAILVRWYRRRMRHALGSRAGLAGDAPDPLDPVQNLHEVAELQVIPLDLDALSREDVAAAEDLAVLESDLESEDPDGRDAFESVLDGDVLEDMAVVDGLDVRDKPLFSRRDLDEVVAPRRARDAGELYGGHTPPAVDRRHPDDDRAFAEGQNWLEALETSAVENGAEPERELDDMVDDQDVLDPPHPSDTRDRPVADHGSGGRRGL